MSDKSKISVVDNTLVIDSDVSINGIFSNKGGNKNFGGITGEIELDCFDVTPLSMIAGKGSTVIITPALATDLVKFKGIADGSIFSQNVRLDLGKTKVNKDIEKSIVDKNEHKSFPLFHNGITVLCQSVQQGAEKIKLIDY